MEPLIVTPDVVISPDLLAVSYTKDLAGETSALAALRTPTAVELRFAIGRCTDLPSQALEYLLAAHGSGRGRRATIRVVSGGDASRAQNLAEARRRLAELLREALEGPPEAPTPERRERRGRRGLIKEPKGRS